MYRWQRILSLCLIVAICVSSNGCYVFWKRYHSKEHKFSILVPRFWELSKGSKDLALIVRSPRRGPKDDFQENVNVSTKELPQEVNLEAFFEVNKGQVLLFVPGAKTDISEGDIYAGRVKGKFIAFSSRSPQISIRVFSASWIKGKRVYIATATGTIEGFPRYEAIFKKMMQSMRILD